MNSQLIIGITALWLCGVLLGFTLGLRAGDSE